jgi:hypothetical protein
MSQTTVSAGGQAIGLAGQVADSAEGRDIVSGFNKEATNQIGFGLGVRVQPGSNGDGFLLASGFSGGSPGMEVAGINVFSYNHMKQGAADPAGNFAGDLGGSGLLPNAGMQVGREGRFIVPVEIAVVAGDRAWCRGIATGTSSSANIQGIWAGTGYNAAGTGSSYMIDCTRQGVFRSGTYTAADGVTKVAILETDFTNRSF